MLGGVEFIRGTGGIDLITLPLSYTNGVRIEGLAGDDTLVGSNNRADTVLGGTGDDAIGGLGGNDRLAGDAGADFIVGGGGNDTIALGRDAGFTDTHDITVDAGDTRTFTVTNASRTDDTVLGESGIDTIVLIRGSGTGYINDYEVAPILLEGVERWIGTSGRDFIVLPQTYTSAVGDAVEINGLGGNDVLVGSNDTADDILGGDGNDILGGLAGDDELSGGNGNDELLGGDGEDTLTGGTSGDDELNGGAGSDTLVGGLGLDTLDGGSENDSFDFNLVAEFPSGRP